jgi:hypothetical protein
MRWTRVAVAAAVAGLSVACTGAAEARGFVGFSFGVPFGPPAYYYPPPVYYPAPAYAYPAYRYPYAYPPPAAYPPPTFYSSPAAAGQTCREYQTTTDIGGRRQPAYGTACLQPDGTWRIVE